MEPKAVLEHLKTVTSDRTCRTLEAIYEVCQEQLEQGKSDFSYTTVARLGEKRGVPKAQSIRNASGVHYRALIESFSAAAPAKKPKYANAESEVWIEELPTARHRLLVQILKSELAEARRLIKEVVPPSLEIYVDDRTSSKAKFKLDEGERRALEHILSEDFLKAWKLVRGDKGDVRNESGERVFKPGTFEALEKALRYL
ncbi:gamma-mobile-trio protein GmtX [Pseudomonas sp. PMCC200344]|uniref:gamma-mobile-trio protein GmtX n=1 Tax=Pseudomonas sp. PMCC200344 TaxID=3042028 RepID=UPI0024B3AE1C|nr:gamma-mobile-trio protein GmtX [Pseudomonas sp. PMCC200344]